MRRVTPPRPIDIDELRAVAEATLCAEPYVSVRVHPRDLEDVRARVQRRARCDAAGALAPRLTLRPDASVARGQFVPLTAPEDQRWLAARDARLRGVGRAGAG